jgi:hypothetical protein
LPAKRLGRRRIVVQRFAVLNRPTRIGLVHDAAQPHPNSLPF